MENGLPKQEVSGEKTASGKTAKEAAHALIAKIRTVDISRQNKRLIIFWVAAAIVAGGLYYFKGLFIAATINGSPVSRWSVVSELEKKAGKNALDTIITKKLIESEMKKSGVAVQSGDIDTEMNAIETQIAGQGVTLEQALMEQGMTVEELREQIMINKGLEQILSDKLVVSDEEVNQYLSANSALTPKGTSSDDLKNQAREQLKGQKFNTEAAKWVSDLRAAADIKYYTQY
ncbi:MAG: hypothetical protein WAW00_02830 [Candidatus Moraniibacteriota bacterium]